MKSHSPSNSTVRVALTPVIWRNLRPVAQTSGAVWLTLLIYVMLRGGSNANSHKKTDRVRYDGGYRHGPVSILAANDRISLGVVGLGGRGTDHLNYYSTLGADCRIAAVCDVNQAARERAGALVRKLVNYSPTEYTDMRAVFDSKEIDAVSLPLPNHWHALATIWACQAGKDVYVEKPASHNLFEAGK